MSPTMPHWRTMQETDLPAVLKVSTDVHPGFPEGEPMFRNRLSLFPAGCLVLDAGDGRLLGYAVSHPSKRYAPPALDVILPALPKDADDYYVHDVALLPQARGGGHARAGIEAILANAAPFGSASLVSVYGTAPFWSRFGFEPVADRDMEAKLRPYGEGAVYMLRAPV